MSMQSLDSFSALDELQAGGKRYRYFSLPKAAATLGELNRLPFSIRILLENLLRFEDGRSINADTIKQVVEQARSGNEDSDIAFRPSRVLMQDFTGVPAVVDLAAMRDAMTERGGDPQKINPLSPVDLVIDHSVMVDYFGTHNAFDLNVKLEMKRNLERYEFLRWGQQAFDNFRVVPPGTGICHQVNLEYLGQVVWQAPQDDGVTLAYPDSLVGTDSHTTMINGLSVLGWGVGGIEAEAAMLGQPISMRLPRVVGFRLDGKLPEGTTATDLVLTVTRMLREHGVVGKFVEFYGPGLDELSLPDRATLANMAPEYGATCGIFPIDAETLRYLKFTGRDEVVPLVEAYAKAQGLWRDADAVEPDFHETLQLDMADVVSSLAGPKRPQDSIALPDMGRKFSGYLEGEKAEGRGERAPVSGTDYTLGDGDVVIAAITSCTNTSNPAVMLAAGLVAKNARARGLKVAPWVKTSLAPGSQVVTDYLERAGLQDDLDALGFDLVGYGCTTCIGNSGPLDEPIASAIEANNIVAASVLSGNRNFEGRINPHVRANYLASPPLVVAFALAGTVNIDLSSEPLGEGSDGKPVYLKDIWPAKAEVDALIHDCIDREMFTRRYGDVFTGPAAWQAIDVSTGNTYQWQEASTYVRNPPYFRLANPSEDDIIGARPLAILGDSVTTDHISPAGSIAKDSPAADYLRANGISEDEFNSYGSRRGNHEVMMRGTFANIRLKNELVPGVSGGYTKYLPDGEQMAIFDAAMRYQEASIPLVVVAGREYGTGSSRDWAAKGSRLLGIRAVIAESFERIHRSNLVGMGVLPLQFADGDSRSSLGLDETCSFTVLNMSELAPGAEVPVAVRRDSGDEFMISTRCRIDTAEEMDYFRAGGILQHVLNELNKA
ncbi:aconitate hydratase AcnA [Granulosicoccaceae sp. 1_MG-2023]|nr:aconitate hydratase AcnA [Granulosicoccaceae sp. 1_MG-2023]